MSIFSQIRSACARYLHKPTANHLVCQAIQGGHVQKIVELGIGSGQRAVEMIETAKKASPGHDIHYVGIDLFEQRSESDGPGLTLKGAYQLLRRDGVRVQLVPGPPAEALIRVANSLGKVDLMVVPGEFDSPSLARTWFFVPRMLHDGSQVFVERTLEDGQKQLEPKSRQEINDLASVGVRRCAA